MEENYKELTKTTYEPGKRFAEIMQTHAKIYLANFAKIDAAGCMTNGEINYDCVSSNAERIYASDDAASSSYASPEDAFVDAEDGKELMEDVILSLPEFGFRINDDFKKENEK